MNAPGYRNRHNLPAQLCAALVLLLYCAASPAQPMDPAPDTSTWVCEFCPPTEQFIADLQLGSGWVSDSSYRYSRYSGLGQGGFVLLDGSALWTSDTDYWRFKARDAGLRSRLLHLDGGAAGRYRLRVRYSETPHFITDSPLTPFVNAGSTELRLPQDWIQAPSTRLMAGLGQSLRPLRLRQDRERFDIGLTLTPAGPWRYELDYQRETRQGVRAGAGAFLFTGSLLPIPIDQVTDGVLASATYEAEDWHLRLSYDGSFFNNDVNSLTWDNPFSALVPGANSGQLALAPDNEYHRLGASGSIALGGQTRLSGRLGYGRMTQDEAYLAYTVNDRLPVNIRLRQQALPAPSLDGSVDVVDFGAALTARPGANTRLAVRLDYYDRDNASPVLSYQPVTMDLFVNEPIQNRPYSFRRQSISAEASHRIARPVRLAAGVKYQQLERSRLTAANTDEQSAWARLRWDLGAWLDASLKLAYSDRDGDEISPEALIAETENPLLRKFHYADRKREAVNLILNAQPHETIQLALSGGYKSDDYDQSALGLTDSRMRDLSADLSIVPRSGLVLHAFYTREKIDSSVAGSQPGLDAGWIGDTVDTIHSLGAGLALNDLGERDIDLSLDWISSRARGEYRISSADSRTAFPDLGNRIKGLRLRLSAPVRKTTTLHVELYHEQFNSTDWALDGVTPDAVFNLLSFGETSPHYSINSVAISVQTRF